MPLCKLLQKKKWIVPGAFYTWSVEVSSGTICTTDRPCANVQNIRFEWEEKNGFCSLRMWKDLNKNRLTLLKMCVSSFLCGFRADLWPFNGSYWNRFALFIIQFRGGSSGRVQGVRTLPWDDPLFSNTTGILPKKKNCVVYWCWSRARDECTPS